MWKKNVLAAIAAGTFFGAIAVYLSFDDRDAGVVSAPMTIAAVRAEGRALVFDLSSGDRFTLDPIESPSMGGTYLHSTFSEGLVRVGRDGNIEPGVAESWTLDVARKMFRVTLKRDRKWSDGNPVVAQDFITAWKRGLRPSNPRQNSQYATLVRLKGARAYASRESNDLAGLSAPDPYTIEITFDILDHLFVLRCLNGVLMPIPDHFYRVHKENWSQHPDRPFNGFYRPKIPFADLEDAGEGGFSTPMVVNRAHPEQDQVRIREFRIKQSPHVRETNSGDWRSLFEDEQFPSYIVAERPPDPLLDERIADAGWTVQKYKWNSTLSLYLNSEVLSSEMIEALKLIVNSREFASRSPNLSGVPTDRLYNYPGSKLGIHNKYSNIDQKSRRQRAAQIISDLGISPSNPRTLYMSDGFFVDPEWIRALRGVLSPYGLRVELLNTTNPDFENADDVAHMTIMLWYVALPDPSGSLLSHEVVSFDVLTPEQEEKFDDLVRQASLANDKARLGLLVGAEEFLINAGGVVPLIQLEGALVHRTDLGGLVPSNTHIHPVNWLYWRD